MQKDSIKILLAKEIGRNGGVLRLAPTWVPRANSVPGRRLKLHPNDYYAFGAVRGGIVERWLSSTTKADNGELTTENEGLSFLCIPSDTGIVRLTLKEAIEELLGDMILGEAAMQKYGTLLAFAKFFDNKLPIPFHLHPSDEFAERTGMLGKPEAYYYPPQLNNVENTLPITYFGLQPDVTPQQLLACFECWETADNSITSLSRGYRLQVGDAWNIDAGILHAPGSLLTYEPQRSSDISIVLQNFVGDSYWSKARLTKLARNTISLDYETILEMIDWDKNTDPDFISRYKLHRISSAFGDGFAEDWIVYGNGFFSAKELTVCPGVSVKLKDDSGYGFIAVQGRGMVGGLRVETPSMIRFGEMTGDEGFVCHFAAEEGVVVTNTSEFENLVLLKHFGPENTAAPQII